jgi:hypothetical protein
MPPLPPQLQLPYLDQQLASLTHLALELQKLLTLALRKLMSLELQKL